MKKTLVLFAVTALAACGSQSAETADGDTTAMTTETPSPVANQPATGSMVGVYEVTAPDGTTTTETINSDGTYVDVTGGEEVRGTWRMDGQRGCFDPTGADPEVCYTTSQPAADGSFTSTAPDGTAMTVRKVSGEAQPTM